MVEGDEGDGRVEWWPRTVVVNELVYGHGRVHGFVFVSFLLMEM